jgi:DNA-binding CsgD family transcriptional regulator
MDPEPAEEAAMSTHPDSHRNPTRGNPTTGCPRGVAFPLLKGSAAVRQREADALDLRAEGLTFQEIGARLGVSRQMAARIVRRGLRALPRESAAELVVLQDAQLDMIWAAMFPRAVEGSPRAAAVCIRVLERRAKLHGLDAPTRTEVRMSVEEVDALDAEIEALLAQRDGRGGGDA